MKLRDWFTDPYSPHGLRVRAGDLPECTYKVFLELAAIQLEGKIVSEDEVKKAIEYFRTGQQPLISVAVKMLRPSQGQIQEVLSLMKTGLIK